MNELFYFLTRQLLGSGVSVLESGLEGRAEHLKWVKGGLSTLVGSMDAK